MARRGGAESRLARNGTEFDGASALRRQVQIPGGQVPGGQNALSSLFFPPGEAVSARQAVSGGGSAACPFPACQPAPRGRFRNRPADPARQRSFAGPRRSWCGLRRRCRFFLPRAKHLACPGWPVAAPPYTRRGHLTAGKGPAVPGPPPGRQPSRLPHQEEPS